MESLINFAYRFHPVGQGLFCTGTLRKQDQPTPFHWTFDCGSMMKKADWISQVAWYRDLVLQNDMLNLLCISHFDKDHVSGLAELLAGKHVDTVVIPYYTPIERLVLGAMQDRRRGQDDGEYNEFLSNPVAFVIERAASVRQTIVVHRSPPQDPKWPYDGYLSPDSPVSGLRDRPLNPGRHQRGDDERESEREQWHVKVREPRPSNDPPPFAEGLSSSLSSWNGNLLFVGEQCHLHAVAATDQRLCPQWEFLFFHKPESPAVVSCLTLNIDWVLKEVEMLVGHRPNLAEALRDESTRKKIRDVYRSTFSGSKRFNTARLCTYCGPVAEKLERAAISGPCLWHGVPPIWPWIGRMPRWTSDPHWNSRHWRPAILYSGDADFHPASHRAEIRAFLSSDRWQDICVLQVPHHGSKHNWQVGSANEFLHSWSVFSADPQYKHHHPDQAVLLDLLSRNPLLVDRIVGVGWSGLCQFAEHEGS